jgi:hypothetical protein
MELVLQVSLLMVTVCVGAAALFRRTAARSDTPIDLGSVSDSWIAEHRIHSREE